MLVKHTQDCCGRIDADEQSLQVWIGVDGLNQCEQAVCALEQIACFFVATEEVCCQRRRQPEVVQGSV